MTDTFIPLCVPDLVGREWDYVKDCLDTGWVSSVGAYVGRFETEFAARAGTASAVATVNGTAALHLALLAAGIQPGDEVLVSTLTFIAPANAVRYCGAHPVLVDCRPDTAMMDVERVREFLETDCDGELINRLTRRRVRALLPVHILGHAVDMAPLLALAERYGLAVIEDATEALGTLYGGRPVGTLGRAGCFSFNGNKMMTTGAGGMVTSSEAALAAHVRHLSTQAKTDAEYDHDEVGFNYRLSNLLAAVGCAQLEALDGKIAAKRAIAARYRAAFAAEPRIRLIEPGPAVDSCWWLPTVILDPAVDRKTVGEALRARAIETRPLWLPLHRTGVHAEAQVLGGAVAQDLQRRSLSLPCSTNLTEAEQARVIEAVLASLSA